MTLTSEVPELYWDATYAIVMALMTHHPECDPETTGLHELADLIEALPGFADDPATVTERILLDIQILWYEEVAETAVDSSVEPEPERPWWSDIF